MTGCIMKSRFNKGDRVKFTIRDECSRQVEKYGTVVIIDCYDDGIEYDVIEEGDEGFMVKHIPEDMLEHA